MIWKKLLYHIAPNFQFFVKSKKPASDERQTASKLLPYCPQSRFSSNQNHSIRLKKKQQAVEPQGFLD
jgi:hypothetical protein